MRNDWATGVATITGYTRNGKINIHCPHCGGDHQHERITAGSHAIVAGCHAGPTRLRQYAIPASPQ